MKHVRRRRHLRPRPSRRQISHQISRIRSTLQLFQLEAVLELQKPNASMPRLHFLDRMTGLMKDEAAAALEQL